MRYLCLGYLDEERWEALSEEEREAFVEQCLAYDDELREGGHFLGGAGLKGPDTAVTLVSRTGGLSVTDGPFPETKEQLGGFFLMEANDLNHAIQLMSKHPGVRMGPFEIRPIDEEFTGRVVL